MSVFNLGLVSSRAILGKPESSKEILDFEMMAIAFYSETDGGSIIGSLFLPSAPSEDPLIGRRDIRPGGVPPVVHLTFPPLGLAAWSTWSR